MRSTGRLSRGVPWPERLNKLSRPGAPRSKNRRAARFESAPSQCADGQCDQRADLAALRIEHTHIWRSLWKRRRAGRKNGRSGPIRAAVLHLCCARAFCAAAGTHRHQLPRIASIGQGTSVNACPRSDFSAAAIEKPKNHREFAVECG